MKIVILNRCFFKPQHMAQLRSLGELRMWKDTRDESTLIRRIEGAEVVIANGLYAPLTERVFRRAPKLRLVVLNSTGYDFTDTVKAKKYGVLIANTPNFSTEAVAEHTLALIFAIAKKIPRSDRLMRRGPYEINPARSRDLKLMGFTLGGKTLGIIGLGNIGTRVAELGSAVGMKVIAHSRAPKPKGKIELVALKKLLQSSDVISLHLPFTPKTIHIIGERELSLMKPEAILINTARGKLIDERALYKYLCVRKISGAGLDVLDDYSPKNPLLRLPNVIFTPHSAWWTKESVEKQADLIVDTVTAFVSGNPINIVN